MLPQDNSAAEAFLCLRNNQKENLRATQVSFYADSSLRGDCTHRTCIARYDRTHGRRPKQFRSRDARGVTLSLGTIFSQTIRCHLTGPSSAWKTQKRLGNRAH